MSAHPLIEAIRQCSCSPSAPASVQHDNGTVLAIAEVAQTDRLAAELRSLRISIPATASWSLPELKQLAKALAERVQYLLEPLALIEVDPEGATVQLRSATPAQVENARAYYEVLAKPGTLHVCRYVTRPSAARELTSMHLTHEQLTRLLADVANVVASDT